MIGLTRRISEWVCFEHHGRPRNDAEQWWAYRSGAFPVPSTVEEALARQGELIGIAALRLTPPKKGEYQKIISYKRLPVPLAEAAE